MSMPCVQVKGAPGAKCLRHKEKMGIMRGSLRPARPDLRPEVRFRPAPAVDLLPVSRDARLHSGAVIGAAVSLAKGDKINYRGA